MQGTWQRYRFHIKAAVDASIVDMWRGDTKIVELPSDYSILNPDWIGTKDYFRFGYLLGSASSGYDEATTYYIDGFKLYNVDPVWGY
jgi:hypothetical protein